jgi:hypothetical protein
VGYVYVFRHGHDDHFKIGRTKNVEGRLKQLQTGSPRPLTVFDVIETPYALEGEKYLHRRLAHKCVSGENFGLPPDEVRDAVSKARKYLEALPLLREEQRRLEPFSSMANTAEMLPATEELLEQRRRLMQIHAEKAQRMAEVADLELEEEHLETAIKLAIGAAKGIDGIATWQTRDGRRLFDSEWLKEDNPELYEAYLSYVPKFESQRFRADNPDDYAAHQRLGRIRRFSLVADVDGAV